MVTFSDLGPTGRFVYHYTKASTALEHILSSMKIRLGPIADTNDPAECPRPGTAVCAQDLGDPKALFERANAVQDEVHAAIKRPLVACFSVDERTDERTDHGTVGALRTTLTFGASSSGWARDRMWAQYADGHRGVCLLLDREKLIAAFRDAFATRGECLCSEVIYTDDAPMLPATDLGAAAREGTAYATAYTREHVLARYFTKRQDWSGEREFRLLLLPKDSDPPAPVFVGIRDALVAVMVGHRFPRAYAPCISHFCGAKIPAFQFRYSAMWPQPVAFPYTVGTSPP